MRPERPRWAALALVVAGGLAAVAAYSPWWFLENHAGTSSIVEYYPGTSFYAGGGGSGGTVPYANYGLVGIASLYEGVLVGTLLLAAVAWAVAGFLFARARPGGGAVGHRLARAALLAVLGLAFSLAAGTVVLQPLLYHAADPGGTCAAAAAASPCRSFWGSSSSAGTLSTWGAGAGWWLDVIAGAGVALGLLLGRRRRPTGGASVERARRFHGR